MNQRLLLAAGLAVLLSAPLRAAATAVPLANLVDDRTALAISITDAPAVLRGWDASPYAKTWNDPQVVKFFAPLREQMKIDEWDEKTKEATGSTVRELLALADGEALLAVPALGFDRLKELDRPPFLAAIQVGDHASRLEKILADAAAKDGVHEQTETFSGATIHLRPLKKADDDDAGAAPATFAWTVLDGVWLVSADKERVFAAVDALKAGGAENALGKSARFLAVRERTAGDQSLFYMNLAAAYPVLKDAVAAKQAADARPNPMGIDLVTLLGALGLDSLDNAYCSARIGETDTGMHGGLGYSGERGLVSLLAYQPGPAPRPDWIPSGWQEVSTGKFSTSQAYAALETLLDSVSPMLSGMAQGQITALNRKLGIDLKRDLVGSLGDEIVSAHALPPGLDPGATPPWNEMDQLIAVSLDNVDAFTRAIEALKQLAGGPAADRLFTKRDYLGETIYTFNPPARTGAKTARGFNYAIANRTLLIGIGSPAVVESALQGMRDKTGGFWKRDDIKTALAAMPDGASTMEFTDMRVLVPSIFETIARLQQTLGAGKDGATVKPFADLSARPDAETIGRYWGLASGYAVKTGDGVFMTSHLVYPRQ